MAWDRIDESWAPLTEVPDLEEAESEAEEPVFDITLEGQGNYSSANGDQRHHLSNALLNQTTLLRLDLETRPVRSNDLNISAQVKLKYGEGALTRASLTPDAPLHVVRAFAAIEPGATTRVR